MNKREKTAICDIVKNGFVVMTEKDMKSYGSKLAVDLGCAVFNHRNEGMFVVAGSRSKEERESVSRFTIGVRFFHYEIETIGHPTTHSELVEAAKKVNVGELKIDKLPGKVRRKIEAILPFVGKWVVHAWVGFNPSELMDFEMKPTKSLVCVKKFDDWNEATDFEKLVIEDRKEKGITCKTETYAATFMPALKKLVADTI